MTERQRMLLALLGVWFLALIAVGLIGGVGSVELGIWVLVSAVLAVTSFTWGRRSSKART